MAKPSAISRQEPLAAYLSWKAAQHLPPIVTKEEEILHTEDPVELAELSKSGRTKIVRGTMQRRAYLYMTRTFGA